MTYPRLQAGDAMYEFVEARKNVGLPVCDSRDHNEGCTNPNCPVWGVEALASEKAAKDGKKEGR